MKKRIKIDSSILSFVIVLTGFLYLFPHLYSASRAWDNLLDFIGLIVLLKGTYLRMVARGHKKENSGQGAGLVKTGPYQLMRNPMYLGSFLVGAGFVLIAWPWWALPIFIFLFYLRFKGQVEKEEESLKKIFGKEYEDYCRKVPRLFPSMKKLLKVKAKKVFPLSQALSTKEKWGMLAWPGLTVFLETFQEKIVFRTTDIGQTGLIFLAACLTFAVGFWIRYEKF